MPEDFTAAALQAAVLAAQPGMAPNGNVDPKLTIMPETGAAMLAAPRIDSTAIRTNLLDTCGPVTVYWPQMDDATNTYSAWTDTIEGLDCTPVQGNTLGANSRTYDINREWKDAVSVNLNDCGSQMAAEERIAKAINDLSHLASKSLNEKWIAELEANKSILPGASLVVDDVTITANGDYLISDPSYWGNKADASQIVPVLMQLAKLNGIHDPIVFSGTSHSISMMNARYSGSNADLHSLRFGALEMFADTLSFDSIVGRDTLYIMDRNTFFYQFFNEYGSAVSMDGSVAPSVSTFSAPLRYYTDINKGNEMQTLQYSSNGSGAMLPINMDVRAQYVCTGGKDRYGRLRGQYNFNARIWSMFAKRPIGSNARTGILKVVKAP